ncbi:MAG: hypothetical protein IPH07_01960 [Deltaproteobacteria bacterium]|nr:hypothetical protein [Deltaproteobacteria bacterium]MBK8718429.1 hypothetical protein [Deltaproteobacteria bacterium]MBP7290576.1 hypothetical protein [Nannocystaceae bacterium]
MTTPRILAFSALALLAGCDTVRGWLHDATGDDAKPVAAAAAAAPTPAPTPAPAPAVAAAPSSAVPGSTPDLPMPTPSANAPAGSFEWVFEPPKQAAMKRYQPLFEHHRLSSVVAAMNVVELPRTVPVVPLECGTPNAFYAPKKHGVVICYELADLFYRSFLDGGADDQTAADATLNALTFVMLHELGHAAIGELELGVTGGEEDAVDDLAALLLVDIGHPDWAFDGARSMTLLSKGQKAVYFDEHSMGEQRFYNITCVVFGSDPMKYLPMVERGLLPSARAGRCQKEYEQKDKAWQGLLAAHLRKK